MPRNVLGIFSFRKNESVNRGGKFKSLYLSLTSQEGVFYNLMD